MIPSTYLPGEPRCVDGPPDAAVLRQVDAAAAEIALGMRLKMELAAYRAIVSDHEKAQ